MSRLSGRIAPTGGTRAVLSSNTIAQIYDLFHFDRRNFFAAKLHSHRQAHYLATPKHEVHSNGDAYHVGKSHPCQTWKKGSTRGAAGRLPVSVTEQKQHKNVCHATRRRSLISIGTNFHLTLTTSTAPERGSSMVAVKNANIDEPGVICRHFRRWR